MWKCKCCGWKTDKQWELHDTGLCGLCQWRYEDDLKELQERYNVAADTVGGFTPARNILGRAKAGCT